MSMLEEAENGDNVDSSQDDRRTNNDNYSIRKPRADIHFPFLFSVFIFHFPISTFEKRGKIG